jgi:phage-related protein
VFEIILYKDRNGKEPWDGNKFIFLHYFTKKTQKTPQRVIDQAKRNLTDYRERKKDDENK